MTPNAENKENKNNFEEKRKMRLMPIRFLSGVIQKPPASAHLRAKAEHENL